jgi:hypothetical protein
MKLRKSISVDFRPSKTRDDGTAVLTERGCSIEIGAVSQHMGFTQPGKNSSTRMPVSIALPRKLQRIGDVLVRAAAEWWTLRCHGAPL